MRRRVDRQRSDPRLQQILTHRPLCHTQDLASTRETIHAAFPLGNHGARESLDRGLALLQQLANAAAVKIKGHDRRMSRVPFFRFLEALVDRFQVESLLREIVRHSGQDHSMPFPFALIGGTAPAVVDRNLTQGASRFGEDRGVPRSWFS
jgi:hypothetical protein